MVEPGNPTYPMLLRQVTRFGYLGVELFFFISGAVIVHSARHGSASRFVRSRAARLLPAYWACMGLTYLVLAVDHPTYRGVLPVQLVAGSTMLEDFVAVPPVDPVYWTLTVELVFYAIVAAVLAAGWLHRIRGVLAGWLGLSVLVEMIRPGTGGLLLGTRWAPFFVAGACLSMVADDRSDRIARRLGALAMGWALFLTWTERTGTSALLDRTVACVVVLASFGLLALVLFGKLARIGRPWMAVAGAVSYPLYLVHMQVGYVVMRHATVLGRWPTLALAVVAVTGLATAVHLLVERPLGPALGRWSRGTSTAAGAEAQEPPRTVAPVLPT